MIHAILKTAVALAIGTVASLSSATVLTFDDLTGEGVMPASYGGFTWTDWNYYDFDQPPYTAASGATRIFATLDAQTNQISSATDFVFNGAYLSGQDYETVSFNLYHHGALVSSTGLVGGLSAVPTFFSSGYTGAIDAINVTSSNGGYFVLDNLTVNAVPEPQTIALMLAGIAMVGGALRRNQGR